MNAPALVKGWCPGLLRPMPTGDGLLARVRPRGGRLSAEALGVLATAALDLGNGHADLTSLGNIQLRGLGAAGVAELTRRLMPLGLVDADPASEARRNIVVSPLAGIDPTALIDITPLAVALAARLAAADDLALPPKFTFLIDDGGALPLGGVATDLRFEAVRVDGEIRFAVKANGDSRGSAPLGHCAPNALGDTAIDIARGLAAGSPDDNGVLHFNRRCGRDEAIQGHRAPQDRFASLAMTRSASSARDCLVDLTLHAPPLLGAVAPQGRMSADMLAVLAEAAREAGAGIRLTPWRAVLAPLRVAGAAATWRARLMHAGFILDRDDPRLRVAACVGAPACSSATTPVRADADSFAEVLRGLPGDGIVLHVSGCAKGCAHRGPARVTLVGRDGAYDLVRDASVSGMPGETCLTTAQARRRLAQIFTETDTR